MGSKLVTMLPHWETWSPASWFDNPFSHITLTLSQPACLVLIMPSAWLRSNKYQLLKSLVWLDQGLNLWGSISLISQNGKRTLYSFGHSSWSPDVWGCDMCLWMLADVCGCHRIVLNAFGRCHIFTDEMFADVARYLRMFGMYFGCLWIFADIYKCIPINKIYTS